MARRRSSPTSPAPSPRLARLEGWLAGHQRLVIGGILLASLAVRLGYYLELEGGPLIRQHRWVQTDMHFFDAWARRIAAGDWLTDGSYHPHLEWHDQIAAAYLRENPEEAAVLETRSRETGLTPSRLLWERWYLGKCFHQEPLYPYLIAVTYKLLGDDVRWVFAWQLLLGALANLLVYLIARRHFGELAAAAAALLALLSSPLLYYELILLRTALEAFVSLLLVYVAGLAFERSALRWWLLAGAALGLAVLLKSTFALFGLLLGCLVLWRNRRALRRGLQPLGAMAAGAVLALAPALARNLAVGAPPLALSSVGALAFICANTEDYDPSIGFKVDSRHMTRILAKSDGRMLPAAIETLRSHEGPASYLRQVWGKLGWTLHWYEKPNNTNFYYYRLHSALLRWLPVTWAIVAPLGIAGLFLAGRRRSSAAPLYLMALSLLASLLLFYVLSRFRAPLLAVMLPFAGLFLSELAGALARRDSKRAACLLVPAALLALFIAGRPLAGSAIRPVDYKVPFETHYGPLLEEVEGRSDWPRAVEIYRRSLRQEPEAVRRLGPAETPRTREEAQLADLFAMVRVRLARALERSGQSEAARSERARVEELKGALERMR